MSLNPNTINQISDLLADKLCVAIVRSVKDLASCKSVLNPAVVYSTDRSKAVVRPGVSLALCCFVFYSEAICIVLPCVILVLYFSVLLALRLPRLGNKKLILVLSICLFDLRLFDFVCSLFLSVSRMGCGLWLWHSLDFSLTFFSI